MPRARTIATLCTAAALACSSPDNQVVGGILGNGSVPNATIAQVGSALSGPGSITDATGAASPREVVMLSDLPELCAALAANPDLLESPSAAFTVLVFTLPSGDVGTFYAGASGTEAGLFAAAGAGAPVYGYPGVSGTVVLSQLSPAQGTFDVEFDDSEDDQYEVYGQFKTQPCAALSAALIPLVSPE